MTVKQCEKCLKICDEYYIVSKTDKTKAGSNTPTVVMDVCEFCYEKYFSLGFKNLSNNKKTNPMDTIACVPLPTRKAKFWERFS